MLKIGSNEVKFKLNVSGTSAKPEVRLVLNTGSHELSFKAEELHGEPGTWYSDVSLPESLKPGTYPFRVETVLNGRLLTPIKREVEVGHEEPVIAVPIKPVKEAIIKVVKPKVPLFLDIVAESEPKVEEPAQKTSVKPTKVGIPVKLKKGPVVYK